MKAARRTTARRAAHGPSPAHPLRGAPSSVEQLPKFEPWERFMLLSHACEEIPPARAAEVLPHVTSAAMVVVRQIMGSKTRTEAYYAIERARAAAEEARRK